MKTTKLALFAFWMTLAAATATLPTWAAALGAGSPVLAPANALLLGVAFAVVALNQAMTNRVAEILAGLFGRLDASPVSHPVPSMR